MASGPRVGEHEVPTTGPTRRRVIIGASIAVVLVAIVVGSQVYGAVFSSFPRGYCQTLADGGAMDPAVPTGQMPLAPTAREAVDAFVAEPSLPGDPLPADGWEEHGGRWVRDLDGDAYLELDLQETPEGWRVVGRSTCGR